MNTKKTGKLRECVKTGKICFKTFEKAHVRIGKIITDDPIAASKNWSAYRCPFCKKVHLTSNDKKRTGPAYETKMRKIRMNR